MPGSNELAVLDRDAEDLAVGGGQDNHLVNQRFEGFHTGLRRFDLGPGDAKILARVAGNRLVVGEARLLQAALRDRKLRCRFVEVGLGRVVARREGALAVIGLLRERDIGLGALGLRLAHRDGLGTKPGLDTGQFRLRDGKIGLALGVFRDEFRIVDPDERCALLHVRGSVDFDFSDAAVNAGGHVEGPGLHFTLHDQRFASGQIPDGQGDHRHQKDRDDSHGRGWRS